MTYTIRCVDCGGIVKTKDPTRTVCRECSKYRKLYKHKRDKKRTEILSIREVLHIQEVYNKLNRPHRNYGDIVAIISNTAVDKCVCCGGDIPEGRQVCVNCEKKASKIE